MNESRFFIYLFYVWSDKLHVIAVALVFFWWFIWFSAKPNREHIFHVKFPDTWTQGDLNNLFRKFGPVSTRWIDSSSAFVVLLHRENVPAVLPTIEKPRTVQVNTFEAFSKTASIEFDEVSHLMRFYLTILCVII